MKPVGSFLADLWRLQDHRRSGLWNGWLLLRQGRGQPMVAWRRCLRCLLWGTLFLQSFKVVVVFKVVLDWWAMVLMMDVVLLQRLRDLRVQQGRWSMPQVPLSTPTPPLDMTQGSCLRAGSASGIPQASSPSPGPFYRTSTSAQSGPFVDGVPTAEGQRGYVTVEGHRRPCTCCGGKLVIDLDPRESQLFPAATVTCTEIPFLPPRPPGPPPPTPPTTPRTRPVIPSYGTTTTSSRTLGGAPSKLVNKLPTLAPVKGTVGGDARQWQATGWHSWLLPWRVLL